MTVSTNILNSDDPAWQMSQVVSAIQRLDRRIAELDLNAPKADANLLDLPKRDQARRNLGIPDGSADGDALLWDGSRWGPGASSAVRMYGTVEHTGLSSGTGTNYVTSLSDLDYDGGGWSVTSGRLRFTAPNDGTYLFTTSFHGDSTAPVSVYCGIRENDTTDYSKGSFGAPFLKDSSSGNVTVFSGAFQFGITNIKALTLTGGDYINFLYSSPFRVASYMASVWRIA